MPRIRPIAVGLPIRRGHVLVLDGFDRVTGTPFHRAIGGGVHFGESAEAAVRREFGEELGVTLDGAILMDVVENIFEYEGRPGHEIAFVFAVESAEIDRLALDAELRVLDEGSPVRWAEIAGIDRPLYPDGIDTLLRRMIAPPPPVPE